MAVSRATTVWVRDVDDVFVEVRHLCRVLRVIRLAELHDVVFPVGFFIDELVDLVVKIAEVVLAKTLVLDLSNFSADLLYDLLSRLVGL